VREVRGAVADLMRRSPWAECLLKETVMMDVLRDCVTTPAAMAVGFSGDEEFLKWIEALLLLQRLRLNGRQELYDGILVLNNVSCVSSLRCVRACAVVRAHGRVRWLTRERASFQSNADVRRA
jgi:hypothetical protein